MVHGALLLVSVSVLCFLFTDLAPGNFFDEMKLNPQISSDTVAALRAQYGLDRPLPVRYWRWVQSVMKGEWGYSFAYNSPVRGLILLRARNTLLLTGCATLMAWLIAVPLGVWTASRAGSWPDRVCMSGTSFFLAVPEMVVVFGLLYFVIRSHALPAGGMISRGFEQFGFAQVGDEVCQRFPTECDIEPLFDSQTNRLQWSLAVQLRREVLFLLSEAKVLAVQRVFHHENGLTLPALPAEQQIAPQFWRLG